MNAKLQTQIKKLFGEERNFQIQKVGWMTVLYPAVNSVEYHKFRKAHQGLTHHDTTVAYTAKFFAGQHPSRETIVEHLVKTYVEKNWKAGEIDIQIAQFLGQLTEKGWNGLINHVIKVLDGKA